MNRHFVYEEETVSSYQESTTPTVSDTTDTDDDDDTITDDDDDTITDSEYEYENYAPETENIFDRIYFDDIEFLDTEKEDGSYYIGLFEYIRSQSELLLGMTVSPSIFYKYQYNNLSRYLRAYSFVRNKYSTRNIQIMQLKIDTRTNTYTVLIKTYWIRLIQIHWRKIYKERMNFIKIRKNISNQKHFEFKGRYVSGNNTLPKSLYGMLSVYNNRIVI